ncbi:hypothetical protein F5X96DRAFT_633194 [Biscogniauxia mediterranea]|nr:hypothetical protein F5X96DRAFT_633194 [Biscogniauxia mediterranea]
MFEIPDAKRVRREDLYGSASDEEDSPDDQLESAVQEKLHARLSGLLNLSFVEDEPGQKDPPPDPPLDGTVGEGPEIDGAEDTGEEAFAFRLFRDEEPSHKVVLTKDDELVGRRGEGGFVVPKRPRSYYFADDPPPEVAKRFQMAAVSADYLLKDAKKNRWGLEKPWKVTSITITTIKQSHIRDHESQSSERKRKRPGKKRRILLRVREKAMKEREEAEKKQLVEKEQHLKDKKKRLNREKKLKRRAKAREAKQTTGGDGAPENSSRASSPGQE